MTRVLLVRHGQSEWNATGRWQGQADPPLTDLGRAQAHHAARSLGVVDAIVASDLQRAADTAPIISGELGRSEERRAGKVCFSTCSSWSSPYHYKKKKHK